MYIRESKTRNKKTGKVYLKHSLVESVRTDRGPRQRVVLTLGQLTVELRISRWFKLRYSTQVRYQLRNGRATTQVTSETSTSGKYKNALKKFVALEKARKSL